METEEITREESQSPETIETGQVKESGKKSAKKKSFKSRLFRFLLNSTVTMVIYFLSFGPMYWEWYRSMYLGGNDFWVRLYAPLIWLGKIDFIGGLLQRYVEWWIL